MPANDPKRTSQADIPSSATSHAHVDVKRRGQFEVLRHRDWPLVHLCSTGLASECLPLRLYPFLVEGHYERPLPRRDFERRDAQPRYAVKIRHIVDAIVAAGYLSLDSQAKALGVKRSTAWTIIKTKHKLDRLSSKTTDYDACKSGAAAIRSCGYSTVPCRKVRRENPDKDRIY